MAAKHYNPRLVRAHTLPLRQGHTICLHYQATNLWTQQTIIKKYEYLVILNHIYVILYEGRANINYNLFVVQKCSAVR